MNSPQAKRWSLLALAAVLAFNAAALSSELTLTRMDKNDNVDHQAMVEGMVREIEHGGNPVDWFTESPFGYPAIRDYQPLAHSLVALIYFSLAKTVPLLAVFVWVKYLAVVLLPLSFFAAARWLELPPAAAAAAALLCPLIATNYLYGLDYGSYVWLGYGLFPQAVAANLLVLTVGLAFRAIRRGRLLTLTGGLLGLTFLSHFIYGYMGAVTICLAALLPDGESSRLERIKRTGYVGAIAFALAAFQLVALAQDGRLINPTHLEGAWKTDSFGAGAVLKALFTGEVLDYGRLPVLSLLGLGGVVVIACRYRNAQRASKAGKPGAAKGAGGISPADRFILSGTLLWILVLFGRSTWGPLLLLLGVPPDMHLHRVVGGVHLFLMLLAATALAAMWRVLTERWHVAAAAAATALLIFPMAQERMHFLGASAAARQQYLAAIADHQPGLDTLIAALKQRGGWVYAGLSKNWGAIFKISDVPFYAFLTASGVQQTSYSYHSLELPADIMARFDELDPAQYRLFDVRSVVGPAAMAHAAPAFLMPRLTAGRFQVFDAPGAGYFDVVDVAAAVSADRHSFYDINDRWLHSGLVAQREHLLLDFAGDAPPALPPVLPAAPLPQLGRETAPGEVRSERRAGDEFQADLEAARPSYALLRMTWHQNWMAYLDGKLQKTYMLSPGFIGVPITEGRHQLVFRYEPGKWRLALAVAGFLMVTVLLAAERSGRLRLAESRGLPVADAEQPRPEKRGDGKPAARRRR